MERHKSVRTHGNESSLFGERGNEMGSRRPLRNDEAQPMASSPRISPAARRDRSVSCRRLAVTKGYNNRGFIIS